MSVVILDDDVADVSFQDSGEQMLKNIARPVRVVWKRL
jgi:hypothetical protein